jgi:hypothetical protein
MATKIHPRGKTPKPGAIVDATLPPTAKPLTPFFTTDPRLVDARQNVALVAAAGIVNGMDQDTIDARLLATLDASK